MTECPEEYYHCLSENEYEEWITLLEDNELEMPESLAPLGDGDFTIDNIVSRTF